MHQTSYSLRLPLKGNCCRCAGRELKTGILHQPTERIGFDYGKTGKAVRAHSDAEIRRHVPFETLRILLKRLGFDERIKGDHHIFTKTGVEEILNLQPKEGKGKPYQVKQVREVILKYHIRIGE